MADNSDYSGSSPWSGMLPLIQAAFGGGSTSNNQQGTSVNLLRAIAGRMMYGAQQARQQQKQLPFIGLAGLNQGAPMALPQHPQANIPAMLQAAVPNGPLSLPQMPQTPSAQPGLPAAANPFTTGNPNPFGSRTM